MGDIIDLLKRPLYAGVAGAIVGLLLGMLMGWVFWPVQWTDLPISATRDDLQDTFLRMSVDSLSVNGDESLAVQRYKEAGPQAYDILQKIKNAPGKLDPLAIAVFEQVLQNNGVYTPEGVLPPSTPESGGFGVGSLVALLAGLLALGLVGWVAYWLFRRPRSTGELTPAQQAREHVRAVERTDYVAAGQEPPIAQYVTSYVIGDDLFDDSFSIDAPSGEFLGECGVGISETIGVGDPKKVTAFEVWMFDKNDIQTVTKVLMSAHAFNDPAYRAKLEAKGELFDLTPGRQVVLETHTLQMVATVADMQYGDGPLPPESYYDRMTLELAIWKK